ADPRVLHSFPTRRSSDLGTGQSAGSRGSRSALRGISAFADLDAPWPEVFDLMWEAYSVGTIPVGAVVVDPAGEIVSRGRNRILDDVHASQLGRTRLAHAELNALLDLSAERTYEDFTLYTALEPCHLCLSAM